MVTVIHCSIAFYSNWHGGVMVKAVIHQGQGGEDPFPAGPRALLSWFQSGRKGLGSCNRFEQLNNQLLTAYSRSFRGTFLGR